jgi:hypothetical protein
MNKSLILMAIAAASLTSCASIVAGTSQDITINTTPADATCKLQREGTTIGSISPTPGKTIVDRSSKDINIECSKPGYQTTSVVNENGMEAWTLGNILLGGIIGLGVDAYTGALYEYDEIVNVNLPPSVAAAPSAQYAPQAQTYNYATPQMQNYAANPAPVAKVAPEPAPSYAAPATAPTATPQPQRQPRQRYQSIYTDSPYNSYGR